MSPQLNVYDLKIRMVTGTRWSLQKNWASLLMAVTYDSNQTLEKNTHWLYLHGGNKTVIRSKVLPIAVNEGPEWKKRYSSTLSLHSAPYGGGCSTPRLGRFTHSKDTVPTVQQAVLARGLGLGCTENLASIGIRSPNRPADIYSLCLEYVWMCKCKTKLSHTSTLFYNDSGQLSVITERGGASPGFCPAGDLYFSLFHLLQTDWGTRPASYPMGTEVLFPPGVKWPELTTHIQWLLTSRRRGTVLLTSLRRLTWHPSHMRRKHNIMSVWVFVLFSCVLQCLEAHKLFAIYWFYSKENLRSFKENLKKENRERMAPVVLCLKTGARGFVGSWVIMQ